MSSRKQENMHTLIISEIHVQQFSTMSAVSISNIFCFMAQVNFLTYTNHSGCQYQPQISRLRRPLIVDFILFFKAT